MASEPRPLVAVDVGNTRLKLGVFPPPHAAPLPHPHSTLSLGRDWTAAEVDAFLPQPPADYHWAIASVNRPTHQRLTAWLAERGANDFRILDHATMPLAIDVTRPDQVGIDRLANAVAVNRLRAPQSPAIVIDMGTALTLSLVTAAGAFAGGAILPGVATSARALHEFTDQLPLVEVSEAPPPIGRSTHDAMAAGLYWGAVGAVRELVRRMSAETGDAEIYLTGGAGTLLASVLRDDSSRPPQFVPHLTLAGIAIAAEAP